MLTVLLLAGAEKLINLAIASDDITKLGLAPLAGKVLRVDIGTPKIQLEVLFTEERLRFEPVTTDSVFEPRGQMDERQAAKQKQARLGHTQPDCSISVDNIAQLLNLMRGTEGNLPIAGDYKVLMQLKQLVGGFDPDIAGQLEPFIGKAMASQLHLLISQLKAHWRHSAKRAFDDVSDWANDMTGNGRPDPDEALVVNDLKQQLLKLRADVAREQAKLDAIKNEQADVSDR